MASLSLTGIFAPGSVTLNESLRTLVLDPKRSVSPGETIRAEFSFSNLGGAPATGVRVRFSHPQGVVHVADADLVDDVPLASGERFIDTNGASVGDLDQNALRRVTCSFRVNDIIEDGTELVFQAALITDQTPLVGSNTERLLVRSHPQLQNSSTFVTVSAPDTPTPGMVVDIRVTIANTGSSSAHDVVLMLPAPESTVYVPHSARIDGRVIAGLEGEAFDYDSATTVIERLAPGASVVVEYQVTIDSPMLDGTRIKASGSIGSREHREFTIASADIVVSSPIDFDNDDTSLSALCDDTVTPGVRVPMILRAVNAGSGIAENLSIAFSLPPGLVFAPGSAHVDGQAVSDDDIAGLHFSIGTLGAGRVVEVGLAGTVAVPSGTDNQLPLEASLRWKGGQRTFSRRLSVRIAPRFNRARNYVEADRGVARAREDVRFTVHVYNDGTAPENNVLLRLNPGLHLEDLRIAESSDEPTAMYREPVLLGIVYPHHERVFSVAARVGSRVSDRSTVSLAAVLDYENGATDLGAATVIVRSRPQVDPAGVIWELATREPLRPGKTAEVVVRFTNSGADRLRDARLSLSLPPELALDRAVDARRDREGLLFGDIAAETTHEARMTLRLLRPVPQNRTLRLNASLQGKGISPVQFATLDLATFAEPQFADSSQVVSAPAETVNAGERLYYEIRLRNDGDGPSERFFVRVVPTNLAVYVPASTAINGMPVVDDGGISQLWSQRGLVLADVNPGVELRIRWEMMVMYPLSAGTLLDTRAVLEWDGEHTHALAAPTLRVVAQPSLGETSAGTAISIARIFPSETTLHELPPLAQTEAEYAAPALPVVQAPPAAIVEAIEHNALPPAVHHAIEERPVETGLVPRLYVDLRIERLSQTIKMLERSDIGGLIQHLFAMRMLFPEASVNGSPQLDATFERAGRALRAPIERLFVRLRMPRLSVTGKDLEDRESRLALRLLADELFTVPSSTRRIAPRDTLRIEGPIDLDAIRDLLPALDQAPLGAVAPWLVNAHILGDTIYYDGRTSEVLGAYRAELISALALLSELPLDEFHRVLTTSVNHALDEAFTGVLDTLRSAANVASD